MVETFIRTYIEIFDIPSKSQSVQHSEYILGACYASLFLEKLTIAKEVRNKV